MTEMYGIVASGFNPKPYSVILDEKKSKAQELFGMSVDLTETSPLLLMLEIQALEEATLWEMCESFYYSGFVDFATGTSLDRVGSLIGEVRKAATKATVTVKFTGINGTIIPEDTVVMTSGDDPVEFVTDAIATIPAGGYIDVACTAVLYGADGNVGAGTITVQKVPIVGVTSITNVYAAVGGTDVETDAVYRLRIKGQVTQISKGTLEAIRQAVLDLEGVLTVGVVEDLDTHMVSVYVDGKTPPDTDVDDAIAEVRPAGIPVYWYGVTSQTVYVKATVTVNDGVPVDASTKIKDALIGYVNGLSSSEPVIYMKVIDAIYDVVGIDSWIEDITELKIGLTTPPYGTSNITMDIDKKANLTSGNIDLDVVVG